MPFCQTVNQLLSVTVIDWLEDQQKKETNWFLALQSYLKDKIYSNKIKLGGREKVLAENQHYDSQITSSNHCFWLQREGYLSLIYKILRTFQW